MNMEFIISNASVILVVVAVICTLISVITEFTNVFNSAFTYCLNKFLL